MPLCLLSPRAIMATLRRGGIRGRGSAHAWNFAGSSVYIAILLCACVLLLFNFNKVSYKLRDNVQDNIREKNVKTNNFLAQSTELYRQPRKPRDVVSGVPYIYQDEVDVRFIVLTYNRPLSLLRCLERLQNIVLDGYVGAIDIWVDRSRDGRADNATVIAAQNFSWKHGPTRVHIWPTHVGINGQWIDSWRPKNNTKEMAVFLEDDVDISPFAFRWLRAAMHTYVDDKNIGSFSLDSENVQISKGPKKSHQLSKPAHDNVFLYRVYGTWGMTPVPASWRQFQDWFHNLKSSKNGDYLPYTPGADLQTGWYKSLKKQNMTDSMWSLWFIHHCHLHSLYTLFPNPKAMNGKALALNRKAKGLHFSGKAKVLTEPYLLKEWKTDFVNFPKHPLQYEYDGTIANK